MEKDILKDRQELKQMPYSVPEGYFDAMRIEVIKKTGRTSVFKFSIAAAIISVITAGILIFQNKGTEESFTEEDYIVFSDYMTSTLYEDNFDIYAEAQTMDEDDIIEYLINCNIGIEEILETE